MFIIWQKQEQFNSFHETVFLLTTFEILSAILDLESTRSNLVPRAFSSTIFKMADRREKTLAHSRNHVTDLSTEGGMAAKIKSERIWLRGLEHETGEKQTKWRQRCAFT